MADSRYQKLGDEEESFYSEPTPVPNEFRPPPPTYQPTPTAMKMAAAKASDERGRGNNYKHRHPETSLLNSTLLSLSADDIGTLPSMALNPPSPLSQPSQSLFEDQMQPSTAAEATGTPTNAKTTAATPSKILSLARARRKQQRQQSNNRSTSPRFSKDPDGEGQKNPPIEEVYMNDEKSNSDGDRPDHASTIAGESDTFFECIEDRSLANRARRSLQSNAHSSSNDSPPSSLDGQSITLRLQKNNENDSSGKQRLDNIEENIGSNDVVRVHESALNALQQLKEELVKSNQRNAELTQERAKWVGEEADLRRQIMTLQTAERERDTDLERLRQDHERLQLDKDSAEKHRNELMEERKKREAQARESARTIKEFRHRILAGDNRHKELKGQLDKLNEELEGALSSKGEMAAEIARAQTERMELESKMEVFRKQLSEATQQRDQTTSERKRFEEELRNERKKLQELQASSDSEIGRLNSSLRKANEALHRLRAEITPKVRSAVQQASNSHPAVSFDGMQHTSIITTASSSAETAFGAPPTLDSAIADRLARLRDSAERAHLIRGHKREITRIKADRDATIQQLESDHADALRKATKQYEAKRKSEIEELTQKLVEQHECHVVEVEEEHQKRLVQLKKDYGRSQEESDESLEEALSRIARVTQDHGREKGRRHALERTVEDLQRRLRTQQKEFQAKYGAELEKRRRHWESEKESLLGNLQRECNIAFDNRRRGINDNANDKWGASTVRGPATVARGNNIHNDITDTSRPIPQVPGIGHRPPVSSASNHNPQKNPQQPQPTGPSPLSMDSASFFPETKTKSPVSTAFGRTAHNMSMGGAAFIMPSPRRSQPTSPIEMFTGIGGNGSNASPSIISKTYSDIDSVLRETEELVQSIL